MNYLRSILKKHSTPSNTTEDYDKRQYADAVEYFNDGKKRDCERICIEMTDARLLDYDLFMACKVKILLMKCARDDIEEQEYLVQILSTWDDLARHEMKEIDKKLRLVLGLPRSNLSGGGPTADPKRRGFRYLWEDSQERLKFSNLADEVLFGNPKYRVSKYKSVNTRLSNEARVIPSKPSATGRDYLTWI